MLLFLFNKVIILIKSFSYIQASGKKGVLNTNIEITKVLLAWSGRANRISTDFISELLIKLVYKQRLLEGWQIEILVVIKKNNTQFFLISIVNIPKIYKKFVLTYDDFRTLAKNDNHKILWSLTTGNIGFSIAQRKTQVASKMVLLYGFWLVINFIDLFTPLLYKYKGNSGRFITNYFVEYKEYLKIQKKRFKNKVYTNYIFAIEEQTNLSFGTQKIRHTSRKRYRFFLSNFFRNVTTYRTLIRFKLATFNKTFLKIL